MRRAQTGFFGALLLAGVSVFATQAAPPPQSSPAIAVRLGTNPGGQPLDGRLLLLVSKDDDQRAALPDQRHEPRRRQQVFGIDVDGLKAGDERTFDAARARLSARVAVATCRPATTPCRRCSTSTRRSSAADGHTVKLPMDRGEGQQWNSAPGNLYSTPQKVTFDRRRRRRRGSTLDKVIPPITEPPRHEVRQARAHPERAAHEVLGPRHVPRRARAAARGLRRASRTRAIRSSSTTATSRAISAAGARRRPTRTSSASTASASTSTATTASSSRRRTSSTRTGRAPSFPRVLVIEIQHANPVLRRLLRGELGQPRPLRRRDHERADPVHREEVPRHRRRLGALHVRRLDRRLGGAGGADVLSRTTSTAPMPPAPIRSTSAPTPWSTSTRTRTRTGTKARS